MFYSSGLCPQYCCGSAWWSGLALVWIFDGPYSGSSFSPLKFSPCPWIGSLSPPIAGSSENENQPSIGPEWNLSPGHLTCNSLWNFLSSVSRYSARIHILCLNSYLFLYTSAKHPYGPIRVAKLIPIMPIIGRKIIPIIPTVKNNNTNGNKILTDLFCSWTNFLHAPLISISGHLRLRSFWYVCHSPILSVPSRGPCLKKYRY